jgi:hypothetical protein
MTLAREPGRARNLGNRAIVITEEVERTLDPPFYDKLVG